jgi:recombination protein RecR
MDAYTESMERLIESLGRLPGIGRRSAERMAFYLLDAGADEVATLAQALHDIKTKVGRCGECGAMAEGERCAICQNPRRDRSRLCIVEKPKDVIRLEATGGYNGLYHVLGGLLAPMEGRGPEQLEVGRLIERVARPLHDDASGRREVEEVILALSPTVEGDGTALYLADRLKGAGVHVTRLARGLPTGASLDYANPGMLADAIRGRQSLSEPTQ